MIPPVASVIDAKARNWASRGIRRNRKGVAVQSSVPITVPIYGTIRTVPWLTCFQVKRNIGPAISVAIIETTDTVIGRYLLAQDGWKVITPCRNSRYDRSRKLERWTVKLSGNALFFRAVKGTGNRRTERRKEGRKERRKTGSIVQEGIHQSLRDGMFLDRSLLKTFSFQRESF